MSKLLLILLLPLNILAQEFVTSSSFDSKTSKGTVVIEFWAEWNKGNQVDFLPSLKDCNAYRVDIVKQAGIQKKFSITSVPTVIILNNGIEEKRFSSNIMLQLNANKKKVQKSIDEITFSKFQ
jgi:thioredoxin-like negative regulator of GroEL|tara:strand:- start:2619 stop:2987 length:369 start_codon:yes stop_codon:yes gene_type:complete